jgi:type II secretory pathway component PulM
MRTRDKNTGFSELCERLRNPVRLRVLVTGAMLLVGYMGIYAPLSGRIDQTSAKLNKERRLQALAGEIKCLQAEVDRFQARLPEETDTNEWVQYVIDGIGRFPLKLIALDSDSPRRVGPYEAVVLHIEVEGEFHHLDSFLQWLETNERLFRVDSASIAPSRGENDHRVMQLTLLGMKA